MNPRKPAVSAFQASQDSPTLARLSGLAAESARLLVSIQPLVPAELRHALQAGSLQDGVWCLLVDNTSVAAKVRQLLPVLEARLQDTGVSGISIRLKVHLKND
jgi:Dna[CI] antecedent, DciA